LSTPIPEDCPVPPRACLYCERIFTPSKYRPDQKVCSEAACQKRRRADYHRIRIASDPEYAQVVRDSRKKWRDEHPSYQRGYWRTHKEAAAQNHERQRQRDRKRHVTNLVKNNLAFDLKRSAAEVWLFGPDAAGLVKNNLVSARVLIYQPAALPANVAAGS
jgi:hypothetical protein